ncbi:hypothetical protein NECAME_18648 [Necator americanus]|uniref:Low-density lipoprotein receptor repeat class B n=1 Tax=Necator americanus TaxID=51031 RepID=W2STP0_NECAM|nr:hypothetical protein NECAME_18648 [Necator americanus]ETN72858.1 hypothetical protein NECAME_18648 [Necator americanus]
MFSEVGEVEGISLDVINRELYYTRSNPPSIWRLSMSADDPSSYPVVPTRVAFLGQGNKPKDIVVHSCRMLIFFTNSGTIPSIERMYYSGYRRERIIEDEIIGESRISIDYTAEKLYFAEINSAKIYRVDFDGKHKEVSGRSLDSDSSIRSIYLARSFDRWSYLGLKTELTLVVRSHLPFTMIG